MKKELTEGHFHEEYIPQNYTFPYPGVRYLVRLGPENPMKIVVWLARGVW